MYNAYPVLFKEKVKKWVYFTYEARYTNLILPVSNNIINENVEKPSKAFFLNFRNMLEDSCHHKVGLRKILSNKINK